MFGKPWTYDKEKMQSLNDTLYNVGISFYLCPDIGQYSAFFLSIYYIINLGGQDTLEKGLCLNIA
jgi:hypothetical protein